LKRLNLSSQDVRISQLPSILFNDRPLGLNLLNGTTWKGTKLRVGEAKPDWKERRVCLATFLFTHFTDIFVTRLLIENGSLPAKRPGANDEQDTPPKKKKRVKKLPVGVGREVQDMKPTTLDNVIHRKVRKVINQPR